MTNPPDQKSLFVIAVLWLAVGAVHAQSLDTIGVTLLRAVTTNLNGASIRVAQPEGSFDRGTNWEVNPGAVGQPVNLFTYISADGSTNVFPNSLSSDSGHADSVAGNFYGMSGGVATNLAHVDNYDANYFVQESVVIIGPVTNYIVTLPATNIDDPVVNQSFTFGPLATNDQQTVDSAYDNYAAQYSTLFISAANNIGNSLTVCAPGTSYNCISVGAYANGTYQNSIGPTIDNGRCKPDITAPSDVTSFSTPQVAGAAAVLMQAGLRGDGGSDTNSAADIRTVKALLLNGAVKPGDWTNSTSSPLDFHYGAGIVNVFNSYEQLAGGKRTNFVSTTVSSGSAHPPTDATNTVPVLSGWDFSIAGSSLIADGVNHYYFNLTNSIANANFTATATLVWNRQQNQTAINDLNLFLYNCANSNLVACSTSLVDNVEHIFVPKLPAGRYDLQVWKAGGIGIVSATETYALAFEFFSEWLNAVKSGGNISISWPVYPDGFHVEAAASLTAPNWSSNNIPPPVFTNNQNVVIISATNGAQFFRLRTP